MALLRLATISGWLKHLVARIGMRSNYRTEGEVDTLHILSCIPWSLQVLGAVSAVCNLELVSKTSAFTELKGWVSIRGRAWKVSEGTEIGDSFRSRAALESSCKYFADRYSAGLNKVWNKCIQIKTIIGC